MPFMVFLLTYLKWTTNILLCPIHSCPVLVLFPSVFVFKGSFDDYRKKRVWSCTVMLHVKDISVTTLMMIFHHLNIWQKNLLNSDFTLCREWHKKKIKNRLSSWKEILTQNLADSFLSWITLLTCCLQVHTNTPDVAVDFGGGSSNWRTVNKNILL